MPPLSCNTVGVISPRASPHDFTLLKELPAEYRFWDLLYVASKTAQLAQRPDRIVLLLEPAAHLRGTFCHRRRSQRKLYRHARYTTRSRLPLPYDTDKTPP